MSAYKDFQIEIDKLLSYVLEADASDLHLLAGKPPIIRTEGALSSIPGYKVLNDEELSGLLTVLLNDFHKKQLDERKQVDFSYSFKGQARFRVNVYYQKGTLGGAFRHIPSKIRTLQELVLPDALADFAQHRQGMVFFVGPTGHGKSTTLAALIDIINHSRAEHIITIEDPIEYLLTQDKSMISQREVYQDTIGFA